MRPGDSGLKPSLAGPVLAGFWIVLLLCAAAGAITLQTLGPPAAVKSAGRAAASPAAATPTTSPTGAGDQAAGAGQQAAAPGAAIAAPDPALLEASHDYPDAQLPRIGADGRTPMRAYAAGAGPHDGRPRVAVIIGGIGLAETDSDEAIWQTPAAVDLAVSPYAAHLEGLLAAARARGHELLIAIPMEPQGYPLNDEGPQALLTGSPPAENARRLEWVLSRITGYAGATGASDGLRGERYAADPDLLGGVEDELSARGLFYVDPRPGQAPPARVAGLSVDLVLDEPAVRTEIDARLTKLEQMARDRGAALGLAGLPRPVTVDRLAAWTGQLASHGLALVPVSALVKPPAATAAK